jgi:FtsP/CotA-like multicopper oxidase with cupredoxin domain
MAPPPPPPASPYPPVHAPTFKPANGTYERWYVINVGNVPQRDVDMHPFHMHLVNFVVTRRWRLDVALDPVSHADDLFTLAEITAANATAQERLDFDRVSRHDTVRVQSNQLVELLVHFPPGYTGEYAYHCHLVEHEDMGMMMHFTAV